MKAATIIARILLGLIYFSYGLNFFVHYFPAKLPPGYGGVFEGALIGSGYFFQYMKVMQIAGGLLLLSNRYVSLVAIAVLPISANIFLFHLFLAPKGMVVAVLVVTTNLLLLLAYRKNYQMLLAK